MPEAAATPFPVFPALQEAPLLDCIHCGICLSACPTYEALGTEADSPRGRIYLVRALAEGRAELTPAAVGHLDACLGCRACESACPSGVPYGELLTRARDEIERWHPRPARERSARRLLLEALTRPGMLAPLTLAAKAVGGMFGGGPAALAARLLFGPRAPTMPLPEEAGLFVRSLPPFTPAEGPRRARVALLAGCVMQVLFQRVNRATVRVLAANGCDVIVPRAAGCCGALHAHNGYRDGARARAMRLIEALERETFDALVINSAGCGSAVREYRDLFQGDPEWEERAGALAARARDVSVFLQEVGLAPLPGEYRRRVAYHDACHLAHGQQVRSQPRELLRAVAGLELVELRDADWCCGSAGIYNFLEPELAARFQAQKVENVVASGASVVVTGNPGCHAWIEAGLRARGGEIAVRHTVEVLDEAYGGADGGRRRAESNR